MEDITVNTAAGRHRITLDGRKQCKVTGVTDVLSFDEGAVLLETVDGMLMIKGEVRLQSGSGFIRFSTVLYAFRRRYPRLGVISRSSARVPD